jgi:thiol-disulfide isomerase/thioredoxin
MSLLDFILRRAGSDRAIPRSRRFRPAGMRLCLLAALGLLSAAASRGEVGVGDPFPSLAVAGLREAALPATAGQVVLVDFWASWCAPCKASFPAYARLFADYRARGLVVIAVSVDEKPDAFAAFVKRLAPPFAVARDEAHELVRQVVVPAMPTCYLVGRDGRVRFVHQGFHDGKSDAALRTEIDALLAENSKSS